jgi:hypothetical protein
MTPDELKDRSPALYLLLYGQRQMPEEVKTRAREELDRLLFAESDRVVHACLYHATTLPQGSEERAAFAHVSTWLRDQVKEERGHRKIGR